MPHALEWDHTKTAAGLGRLKSLLLAPLQKGEITPSLGLDACVLDDFLDRCIAISSQLLQQLDTLQLTGKTSMRISTVCRDSYVSINHGPHACATSNFLRRIAFLVSRIECTTF